DEWSGRQAPRQLVATLLDGRAQRLHGLPHDGGEVRLLEPHAEPRVGGPGRHQEILDEAAGLVDLSADDRARLSYLRSAVVRRLQDQDRVRDGAERRAQLVRDHGEPLTAQEALRVSLPSPFGDTMDQEAPEAHRVTDVKSRSFDAQLSLGRRTNGRRT